MYFYESAYNSVFLCVRFIFLIAGVWTKILEAVGVMAVIANGLVIGISSDFIPRLVYRYHYGPCANGSTSSQSVASPAWTLRHARAGFSSLFLCSCMQGYINDTLSTAYMRQGRQDEFVLPRERNLFNVTQCRWGNWLVCFVDKNTHRRTFLQIGYNRTNCVLYSYRDYRDAEDYSLTPKFWLVLAMRFAFVILFEVCSCSVAFKSMKKYK